MFPFGGSLPRPSFKSGDNEEREHRFGHIIIVEGVPFPDPLLHDGVAEVPILVADELALASVFSHLGPVRAHEELALEQLDADDGEHELEQQGDEDNVADGLDGNDHTLDDMFETLGTIDGTERT